MKVQDLIANAPPSKEEERFVEVRVRLFTYGNEAAVWKTVRSFMRYNTLQAGNKIEFYVGGELLEDEDDHAILDQVEQEVPPTPEQTPPAMVSHTSLSIVSFYV